MSKIRYSDIAESIDVDAFESAIGFEPRSHDRGWDNGFCIWPANHTHGDTTGKFGINRESRTYNCYVCGGGSFLSLAMELYNFDADEAATWLSQFVSGDNRDDTEFKDYLLRLLDDVQERVATMPYFNPRVLERFNGPVDYFHTRGISDEIIEQYKLCYGEHIMKPSPIKVGRDGVRAKEDDDYYGPTAIFPHYWGDRLVGWQHRWMDWDQPHTKTPRWLAKYTNTTDFPKSNTLFNYDNALKARERVVVCESVPTVLFLASHDIPAVSYFGSKPTPAQLRLLRRFGQGVILAPDNDSNGDTLLNVATPYLERFIPVYRTEKVDMGPKADLGDYAQCDNPEEELRWHLDKYVYTTSGVRI